MHIEPLEARQLLATFTVANLIDAGAGSLRQAILDANATHGADLIEFSVAGTIQLTSGALPAVSDEIDIDGTSAPGFAGAPVIEIDHNGFGGIRFNASAGGSALRSVGIISAAGAGVTLSARNMLVVGNFIGLRLDGVTSAGNGGNGIGIAASSSDNTIGGTDAIDRNVISANHDNGIAIKGASRNQILGNFIGTDVTGAIDLGNSANGVLLINGATHNTIGGTTPSASQFIGLPPDGNVISGNDANGVLITDHAQSNTLAGNFIGTDISGLLRLGNAHDGVAILNGSNNNALLGTFINLDPFLFYNVVSGNERNGLRIHDSNNTVIQANFFGLGRDNIRPVGNTLNGVVVEGSSANTVFGGVIPLGNVTAANGLNGVELRDTSRGFIAFNTFAGTAAFTNNPFLGNTRDGFLITSTGGNNLIRTSVISRNGDDGVEVSGAARGVQVVQNIIGLDTAGEIRFGNVDNGVEIGGNAHDIVVGGAQPTFSIIPHNGISANGGHGVAIVGNARDIEVNFSFIGTNLTGEAERGNDEDGVFVGGDAHAVTVGSTNPDFKTLISGNLGNGVEVTGPGGNRVVASLIGTDKDGSLPIPNGANGVVVANSTENLIGGTGHNEGNVIAFNTAIGVSVAFGSRNGIRANSIHDNGLLGIDLGPGGNNNQVAPVLSSVVEMGNELHIAGNITSAPRTTFDIDLFANLVCDPSGFGEGRFLLGSVRVRTNAAGFGAFTFVAQRPAPGANVLTPTATDPNNNTSEFSECALPAVPLMRVGPLGFESLLGAEFTEDDPLDPL